MANTFYPVGGKLGVDLENPTTTLDHNLGDCVSGNDATEWVYVQANGAIAQYDAVAIDETYQAIALTKAAVDDGHMVAFAQSAFADNEYGWVALKGAGSNFKVNVLASCAADVVLYSTATAGKLDDISTSQTKIDGVVITATDGGSGSAIAAIATYPKSTTF